MAKRLDQVIVVDVESTCWEGAPPPGQESEIIEIGISVLDIVSLSRLDRRCILVRPERSTVSAFCTQLTTLQQTEVEQGMTFAQACTLLRKEYGTKERLWASYGDYDRRQFERQCRAYGVDYPFGVGHINVKSLFAITYALRHEVGMSEALRLLKMPLEGTHHRGVDDAWNIGQILLTLLKQARANAALDFKDEEVE